MKAIADRIVTLGFGKYVRADKIVALVPIEEDRGSGRRTLVYVEGLPDPLVAGRTEGTILRDMVGAESASTDLCQPGLTIPKGYLGASSSAALCVTPGAVLGSASATSSSSGASAGTPKP